MKLILPPLSAEQLETAYASVETGESALKFAEKSSNISSNVLHAAQTLERILPPVKVVLSGLQSIYLGFKYINKFRKKEPTKVRVAGATINLSAALISLAFALAMLFVPALIPLFTLLIVVLGVGRETFNLAKTSHAHVQTRNELREASYHINRGPDSYSSSDYAELVSRHEKLALKYLARKYKLAHHVIDVAIGLLCVVAVALVMTIGPVGWIVFAAVALTGLALKISLSITKNVRIKRAHVKLAPKPKKGTAANDAQRRESEGEYLSYEHHPHRTAEIVDELQHHSHCREHLKPDHVTKRQTHIMAEEESKIFEQISANEQIEETEHPHPENKPKPTEQVEEEDNNDEREGESQKF